MERRTLPQIASDNIRTAIDAAGFPLTAVAEAADLTVRDLNDRLNNGSLSVVDLVKVGGFLRIRPTALLNGAS